VSANDIAAFARVGELIATDQERFGVGGLGRDDGSQHRCNLVLDRKGDVDLVEDASCCKRDRGLRVIHRVNDFDEDQEELEGVDRAHDRIVVGVLAVVQIE